MNSLVIFNFYHLFLFYLKLKSDVENMEASNG